MEIRDVNQVFDFNLEILTPTHIGMGQEKNYLRGLDFMIRQNPDDNGKTLYILKPDTIIKQVARSQPDLTKLTTKLSQGRYADIEFLLNQLNVLTNKNIVRYELAYDDNMTEIKRFMSNGLGNYYIPGSSIKGSLYSIIYNNLKSRYPQAEDQQLFGRIESHLMSLLNVGDVALPNDSVKVYRTKVYSANGKPDNGEGKWKQHNNKKNPDPKHIPEFSTNGFISFYEAIKPKTKANLIIKTKATPYEQKARNIPNSDLLFNKNANDLIVLIRSHTEAYLRKEKEYFNKYPNNDLGNTAIAKIDSLLEQNVQTDSCVLRVGANVGFHAITGDWQKNDHISPWIDDKHQIKAKTRKFAFTRKADGSYDFHPMGFIKLTLQNL